MYCSVAFQPEMAPNVHLVYGIWIFLPNFFLEIITIKDGPILYYIEKSVQSSVSEVETQQPYPAGYSAQPEPPLFLQLKKEELKWSLFDHKVQLTQLDLCNRDPCCAAGAGAGAAAGCRLLHRGRWAVGPRSSLQPAPASSHGPRAEILQEFGNDIADTLRRCTVLCTNASTSLVEDPGPDSTKFGWDTS